MQSANGTEDAGFIGSTYSLTFDEFATEQGFDILSIYDGPSADAPMLARLSGTIMPDPIVTTGRSVFLHFVSNDNTPAVGFRISFQCNGNVVNIIGKESP